MSEPTTQLDAVELLVTDHAEVEQMFVKIESLPESEAWAELVRGVVRELSVRAAMEEPILYPTMRKALRTAKPSCSRRSTSTSR